MTVPVVGDNTGFGFTWGRWPADNNKEPLFVSPYAMEHAEYYGLRPTMWRGGRVIRVELALMDADSNFIDEDGCNCDLDSPCNNPRCVMERGHYF